MQRRRGACTTPLALNHYELAGVVNKPEEESENDQLARTIDNLSA